MQITGGCLCRAVRYSIRAAPIVTRTCWCRVCQYIGAGGATVNTCFPSESLTVSGELRDYRLTADSGNVAHRRFCGACGTHLFSASEARPHLIFARRPNTELAAAGECSDDPRFEARISPQPLRPLERLAVVPGERDGDPLAAAVRFAGEVPGIYGVECTHQAHAWQKLSGAHAGALAACLRRHVAIALRIGIAGGEHDLSAELGPEVTPDLRQRRVGDRDQHDIAEQRSLARRARPGPGSERAHEPLELLGVTRGHQHLMARFRPQ